MKSRVKIRFKSGFELLITCDKFSIKTLAGEITSYDIAGIADNKPLFFRPEDVECIFQEMNNEETEGRPD